MQIPDNVNASRTFIKKAYNFIRYYPLTRKDPMTMLLDSINEICDLVSSCSDISELEPINEIVKQNGGYQSTEGLFQLKIQDEERRVIIYRPSNLLGIVDSDNEIVYLYDILVIE